MRYDFYAESWCAAEVKGKICLFNDYRIDRKSVPNELTMYELADECDGIPCRMRPGILVNFFGTIVTDEPFEIDYGDVTYLDEGDFRFLEPGSVIGEEAKSFLEKIKKGEIIA